MRGKILGTDQIELIEERSGTTQGAKVRGSSACGNDLIHSASLLLRDQQRVTDYWSEHSKDSAAHSSESNTERIAEILEDKVLPTFNVLPDSGLLILDHEDSIAKGHRDFQRRGMSSL